MSILNIGTPQKSGISYELNKTVRKALYGPHFDGSPNAKEQAADAAVADATPVSARLPDAADPNVIEAARLEDKKARKRKGVQSTETILRGGAAAPSTTSQTLLGGY